MPDVISAKVHIRASYLREMLSSGSVLQVGNARDRLRAAMVEGHRAGLWRGKPEKLREYMQLIYNADQRLKGFDPDSSPIDETEETPDRQRA